MGPAPLQRPFAGAFPHANSKLKAVRHQRAQERRPRTKGRQRANDQPHPMVDVFVRIIHDLAGRVVDIAPRKREVERPSAGLLYGALIPPWLEEMELRRTHGALSPHP